VLSRNRYTTLAGTLVFFLILSIVPFLFWLTLLFGTAGIQTEGILELDLFGWAKDFLLFLKENAEGATAGVSVLFLATTLWSSSSFFYHLRRSGEIIYGYNRVKNGWRVRVSAFLVTLCILLYFVVTGSALIGAIIVSRYLQPYIAWLSWRLPRPPSRSVPSCCRLLCRVDLERLYLSLPLVALRHGARQLLYGDCLAFDFRNIFRLFEIYEYRTPVRRSFHRRRIFNLAVLADDLLYFGRDLQLPPHGAERKRA